MSIPSYLRMAGQAGRRTRGGEQAQAPGPGPWAQDIIIFFYFQSHINIYIYIESIFWGRTNELVYIPIFHYRFHRQFSKRLIESFIESFNEAFNEAFNGLPSSPCAPPSHSICICLSYVCHIPIQLNGIHKRRGVPPPLSWMGMWQT